jgi:hypothetical protein
MGYRDVSRFLPGTKVETNRSEIEFSGWRREEVIITLITVITLITLITLTGSRFNQETFYQYIVYQTTNKTHPDRVSNPDRVV